MSHIILGFADDIAHNIQIKENIMNEMIGNIQGRSVPSLMEAAMEASGASPYQAQGMMERNFHNGHKGYVYAVVERIKKSGEVRTLHGAYAREVATCIYEGENLKELEYEDSEEIAHVVVAVTKAEATAMVTTYNNHTGRAAGSGNSTLEALVLAAATLRAEKLN